MQYNIEAMERRLHHKCPRCYFTISFDSKKAFSDLFLVLLAVYVDSVFSISSVF